MKKIFDHYFVYIAYLHISRRKILDKYTKMLIMVFSGCWHFHFYILLYILFKRKRLHVILEHPCLQPQFCSHGLYWYCIPIITSQLCKKHINTWEALLFSFFFKYGFKFSRAAVRVSPIVSSIELTITTAFINQSYSWLCQWHSHIYCHNHLVL